ncbi:MAG: S46 family peptidase [Bacteroides sp.]|nr:S46 family peptidase [Roseburia sp.]MCM1346746.1 S46 family peptidase [Bacteroides sp.]MCM1421317.1 S46 family peptidase [Bacteroides sp.]
MKKLILSLVALLSLLQAKADEGMWMICNLSQRTDSILQSLGLELTQEELYNADGPSLNNAIVMFGGFCSGVVVSNEGLVFTNHHCGFGAIQEHSTPKHDYLTDGFVAKSMKDELPNPDLYVAFHLRTVDVTDKVMNGVTPEMGEEERSAIIDSISAKLIEEVDDTTNAIYSEVNAFYKGSKYYMSVYQRFDDVRLVFAPPQSLGKFGGDTDNWMWPRQTCDFSVFRIYADKNNKPAAYSKDNVPYHPVRYAHVSLQGYQEGSYCMTLGYPGSTDRYLSSYGIENEMRTTNDLRIQVRGVKQDILKDAMSKSDAIRIMYASKYANSSNYWKYSIGQNKALEKLGVIDEKRTLESDFEKWVATDSVAHAQYIGILDTLRTQYAKNFNNDYSMMLWQESFWNGSDILRFIVRNMMGAVSEKDDFKKKVEKEFKDIDVETDKRVFAALLRNYAEHVPDTAFLPAFYETIQNKYNGDYDKFANALYSKSVFAKPEQLAKANGLAEVGGDLMMTVAGDAFTILFKIRAARSSNTYERKLGEGIRAMNHEREYYPDANFTLRMSYGIVEGYSPTSDLTYVHYTLPQSLTDKYEKNPGNDDYTLLPKVYKWLKKGNFGSRYADSRSGEMQLCFLTNNDITGGNSGSGMFDGKGRLIGLAFDGNWEAMSGDLKFDNNMQRCIGVDIRYVLSVIESYGKAKRLINELTLE